MVIHLAQGDLPEPWLCDMIYSLCLFQVSSSLDHHSPGKDLR